MTKIIPIGSIESYETPLEFKKAVKIGEMLGKGRRHFGTAAASLTQLDDVKLKGQLPKGWKRTVMLVAQDGELTTSNTIQYWLQTHDNTLLFDSIHIHGAGETRVDQETGLVDNGDTDHVVLCGNHVLLVDSKAWKGGRRATDAVYWLSAKGEVLRFGKSFAGGKVHMGSAIRLWGKYFKQKMRQNIAVEGLISMTNRHATVSDSPINSKMSNIVYYKQHWRLTTNKNLPAMLTAWYENIPEQERYIDPNIALLIASQCCKPYRSEVKQILQNLKIE